MDALLTPVVTHFLKSFIKTASGEEASKLRVSLSRGVVLHNLELNLDRLTSKLPLRIERAFAKQLTLRISWTALAQQPIQVGFSQLLHCCTMPGCSSTRPLSAGHIGYSGDCCRIS